jgi:xylulokinase
VERVYVGIDLGTSSVRALGLDASGATLAIGGRAYPTLRPTPDRAEQDPETWWSLACEAVRELLASEGVRGRAIGGVGLSAQMHALVLIDAAGEPVRPAIIWPDTRTRREREAWARTIGVETVERITCQPLALGMYGLSLDWVRANEPDAYERAALGLLTKDYVRYRLTGTLATDASDASGTLLFDARRWAWSDELVERAGLRRSLLPELASSSAVAGTVTRAAAAASGLPEGTPVVVGGSDQSMAVVGLGLGPGDILMAGSTGGTVVALSDHVPEEAPRGVHSLAHAEEGRWLVMSALLAGGGSFAWLGETLSPTGTVTPDGFAALSAAAAASPPGAHGLLFLPHLNGERLDGDARGAFLGLARAHVRGDLARAVMEGVACALRASLEAIVGAGLPATNVVLSGGGFHDPTWRQVQADVLGRPVDLVAEEEHSARGAALWAARSLGDPVGVGSGPPRTTIEPVHERVGVYAERFRLYQLADARVRGLSHALVATA